MGRTGTDGTSNALKAFLCCVYSWHCSGSQYIWDTLAWFKVFQGHKSKSLRIFRLACVLKVNFKHRTLWVVWPVTAAISLTAVVLLCSSAKLIALSPYHYSLYHWEHYFIKGSHKLLISLSVSPCEEDLLCVVVEEESKVFCWGSVAPLQLIHCSWPNIVSATSAHEVAEGRM